MENLEQYYLVQVHPRDSGAMSGVRPDHLRNFCSGAIPEDVSTLILSALSLLILPLTLSIIFLLLEMRKPGIISAVAGYVVILAVVFVVAIATLMLLSVGQLSVSVLSGGLLDLAQTTIVTIVVLEILFLSVTIRRLRHL